MGHSRPLFLNFHHFNSVDSKKMFYIKVYRWLDWNHGPLVSEATALPSEPQQLPLSYHFYSCFLWHLFQRINIIWNIQPRLKSNTTSGFNPTSHFGQAVGLLLRRLRVPLRGQDFRIRQSQQWHPQVWPEQQRVDISERQVGKWFWIGGERLQRQLLPSVG